MSTCSQLQQNKHFSNAQHKHTYKDQIGLCTVHTHTHTFSLVQSDIIRLAAAVHKCWLINRSSSTPVSMTECAHWSRPDPKAPASKIIGHWDGPLRDWQGSEMLINPQALLYQYVWCSPGHYLQKPCLCHPPLRCLQQLHPWLLLCKTEALLIRTPNVWSSRHAIIPCIRFKSRCF